MQRWSRILAVMMAWLVLSASSGCVKLKQVVTVMPDRSGKIELSFGLSEQLVELAKDNKEDPFKEILPDVMKDKSKGIVAFTEPKREKQGEFTTMTYTVYFRDINKVSLDGLGEGEPAEYRYTQQGDSAALSVRHGTILSLLADYEPTPENERAEVRQAMAGLAFSEHFILPGEITPIDGIITQANTAKLDLTLDHVLDGTGPIEELKGKQSIRLTTPRVTVDDAQVQAFNKELEAAVRDWQLKQQKAD